MSSLIADALHTLGHARWPCRRAPGRDRPGRRAPPASRRSVSVPRSVRTDGKTGGVHRRPLPPTRPSSEQVTHVLVEPHASSTAAEEPRVLEAHMRELPQHVVAQHDAAVVRGRARFAVDPEHVIGRAGLRSLGPAPTHTVVSPHTRARCIAARPAPTWCCSPRTGCLRPRVARIAATGSSSVTAMAGSARVPMITGCTNSTATWCACSGHSGARHHMLAPAAKRRATASAAPARSAPASGSSRATVIVPTRGGGRAWKRRRAIRCRDGDEGVT